MKSFAVVVTFNGMEWIDKCINSLLEASTPLSIVIVDNNSDDETVSYIQSQFSEIHLICSPENIGFGRANNLGVEYAMENQADYILLLNQDAWIERVTLDYLLNAFANDDSYGLIAPMHLNEDKTNLDTGFKSSLFESITPDILSDLYMNKAQSLFEIEFVNAAAWVLSRKCLEMVGGFDPAFFMYGEDLNYIHRVRYFGFKVGICPRATICHARKYRTENDSKMALIQMAYSISFLKNINWPLAKQYRELGLTSLKIIFNSMLAFNFRKAISQYKLLYKCIFSFIEIYQSRHKSKYSGAYLCKRYSIE